MDLSLNVPTQASSNFRLGSARFQPDTDRDNKDELLDLQKQGQKKSVLDKLLKHSGPIQTQPYKKLGEEKELKKHDAFNQEKVETSDKPRSEESTKWIKKYLIVKIKNADSKYFKLKGEVIEVINKEKIRVKIQNDQKDVEIFKEQDLGKVLPGEGGIE
ncbi:UNKNOWN [Stylonychia lemnae]|uniref:Uncharacterized protein n=1 Tax=Stylonychia lemnae TaxID=5949 RepID=A0A078AXM0_STYLE|nr:UNKNOWN [Stylonychia lemnae]|eukprot:CDW86816.1 UNKNOWN [Stylonychia lemnae]